MNDLIIVDTEEQIQENQRKIMQRDGSKVFPINNALKKELRRLKGEAIGDLRTQISFIKEEKWKSYLLLHEKKKKALTLFLEKENKKVSAKVKRIMSIKRKDDLKIKAL